MKLATGQILLEDLLQVEQEAQKESEVLDAFPFKPIIKPQRKIKPLGVSLNPSVTLHKGGGRIVVKPDDVVAWATLQELQQRLLEMEKFEKHKSCAEVPLLLLDSSECSLANLLVSRRVCSLVVGDIETHPLVRVLKSFGLQVKLSLTLENWLVRAKRRHAREMTPFLLPEVKDSRLLFEKAEAGMIFDCIETFKAVDNRVLFVQGQKYQVLDTARSGEDGQVTISTQAFDPKVRTVVEKANSFIWTPFEGAMEKYFQYQEPVVYEPDQCVPAKYKQLVGQFRKKLEKLNLPLYEHVRVDCVQAATKRSVLDAKLMRMGKSSSAIATSLLWGPNRIGYISPRNARIFFKAELERLGIKDYVVVDSLSDLDKPARFYLLTHSWVKRSSDPARSVRRSGQGYLSWETRSKQQKVPTEHKCPHCSRTLERRVVTELKNTLGTVLHRVADWTKEGGYICRNENCSWFVDTRTMRGAAWSRELDPGTGKWRAARKEQMHGGYLGGDQKQYVGYTDLNLKVHFKCEPSRMRGRLCTQCGQADGVWIPGIYRRCKDRFNLVILDEAHVAKSVDSDVGKAIRAFRAKRRLALTGTPMPNTPSDVYWPMHWIFGGGSDVFPYHQRVGATVFYDEFCEFVTVKRGAQLKDSRKMLPYLKNPKKFWQLAAPKVLRRNYEDSLFLESLKISGRFLPNLEIKQIHSKLDLQQAALIIASIENFQEDFESYVKEMQEKGHMLNSAMVMTQMSSMRMAATIPDYFNEKRAKAGQPAVYFGPPGGGKMKDIRSIVMSAIGGNSKVVILSEFISMQKTCAEQLDHYGVIRFDPAWDDDEREAAFAQFRDDPAKQIFVGGTRARLEGVDLSVADTVICTDLLWEPGLQMQSWSRVLTPREKERTCTIYLLTAMSTIDQHIYNTFYAKVAAAEQALDRRTINRRANQVDIRWFVDRVVSDRESILQMLQSTEEEIPYVVPRQALRIEERVV